MPSDIGTATSRTTATRLRRDGRDQARVSARLNPAAAGPTSRAARMSWTVSWTVSWIRVFIAISRPRHPAVQFGPGNLACAPAGGPFDRRLRDLARRYLVDLLL